MLIHLKSLMRNYCVLISVEKEIPLREKLESSYPQLKAFYQGEKVLLNVFLLHFCKLIILDTSVKLSSLPDKFNIITESEGRVKPASMHQERRFTKLGTTAACVVKSIDLYNKLLEHTSKRNLEHTSKGNLLVKAYQLDLNCVLCAFKCLAYFTYKIGMPCLNMCKLSSQKVMKHLLPHNTISLSRHEQVC